MSGAIDGILQALLALLPCAVVLIGVLGLGWSGLAAAGASLVTTLALVGTGAFRVPTVELFGQAGIDAGLMTLLVSATLVPGILFVEATARLGAPQAIARVVTALRLPVPQAGILIALGLGVMVEGLTGMGVSLLLTTPLLAALLPRSQAIALALVGMSLMPWGALAIAGTVGATLADIDVHQFGKAIWRVSGPVAALLPLIATWIASGRRAADLAIAMVAGGVLWAVTGLMSWTFGMALAGVGGGLAVLMLMAWRADRTADLPVAIRASALLSYALLIGTVSVQALAVAVVARQGWQIALSTGRVSFALLGSPGVALVLATLLSAWRVCDGQLMRAVVRRSWRAVASVALFMLTARLLVASGAIDALTAVIQKQGTYGAMAAAIGLGAVGGFVTGSGVTGNALFLPSAAAAGVTFGNKDLFSALASSASGHAAMASLPVAALLLAVLPERTRADDRTVLRWGLMLVAVYLAVLMGVGVVMGR
jgi:lactate permease